jgi:hypothetical protein
MTHFSPLKFPPHDANKPRLLDGLNIWEAGAPLYTFEDSNRHRRLLKLS